MSGLKATEQDRLRLSGAIHRMGERTGSAAERILDDLDTLLAENAKLADDYRAVLTGVCTSAARAGARDATLRAAEVEVERLRGALRGMLRAHPNCHSVNCGGYGCDDDCLTDDPDGDTGGEIHVCDCGAVTARNAARAALGET